MIVKTGCDKIRWYMFETKTLCYQLMPDGVDPAGLGMDCQLIVNEQRREREGKPFVRAVVLYMDNGDDSPAYREEVYTEFAVYIMGNDGKTVEKINP